MRSERRVGGSLGEEVGCLGRRHREHLGDVLAVEQVLEHLVAEAGALAQLAQRLDGLGEAERRDDHAEAAARGARALGVRAEQRGLDAVRLREGGADGIEDARCRSRGCCGATPLIGAWSTTTTSSKAGTLPWMSEDLPEPATPVTTVRMPSGMSTSTFLRLCWVAPRISSAPFGARVVGLRAARGRRGGGR